MTPRFASVSDQLYRDGGFYDEPTILQELRAPGRRTSFVTDIGELWPSYHTHRQIDGGLISGGPEFVRRLISHYEQVNATFSGGAASHVALLRDVYVLDSAFYRIVGNATVRLYETARANDRPYQTQPVPTPHELRRTAIHVDGTTTPLYLGSAGSSFYRHWLLDDLPRAAAINTIFNSPAFKSPQREAVEYVIPGFSGTLNQLKQDSLHALQLANPGDVVRFVPHDAVLHLDQVYYATPVSYHPSLKSPDAVGLLRDRGRNYPFQIAGAAERMFVHDSSAPGPAITNQAAMVRLFRSKGFTILDVAGITFGQQLATMRRARLIAGPIGDPLANIVFCEPGATVLQLAPEGDTETFYWDLAETAGHEFGAVYGTPVNRQQTGTTIDLAQLSAILAKTLPE